MSVVLGRAFEALMALVPGLTENALYLALEAMLKVSKVRPLR